MVSWTILSTIVALALGIRAAPVESSTESLKQLTQADFSDATAKGLWLIEFFSPYCVHCKRFKSTWQQLTLDKASKASFGFQMAQVDCIAQGDLCNEQNVTFYPKITMYQDGQAMETYNGDRSLEDVSEYIDEHVRVFTRREISPGATSPIVPNALGHVVQLTDTTFGAAVAEGPLFVKMFAPWCGHCKKLAPVWTELASRMKGVVNIGEVNCDEHSTLCKKEGVSGYPTLTLYQSGNKLDYHGARTLVALEPWITKAVAASSGLPMLDTSELEQVVKTEPAFFVYLRTFTSPESDLDMVTRASHAHLGGIQIYQGTDPDLFDQFGADPASGSVIVSVKDHQVDSPSILHLSADMSVRSIERWLNRHRFPSAFELTAGNFPDVMRSSAADLVVLTVVGRSDSASTETILGEASRVWNRRAHGPSVLFVWMDFEQWEDWLRTMYGVKSTPSVVLADHKHLLYYDVDETEKAIALDARKIVSALDAMSSRSLVPKHSENWIERKIRVVHNGLEVFGEALAHHLYLTLFAIIGTLAAVFFFFQRIVAADTRDLSHRSRMGARLD
ncbi:hypothetical protein BS47DRAFT_1325399 [Hydnum rufescens UP504]|uniref:Thioredoxin domain-containing protein n=1 Tax=Hydnum rufescens UP504 TaxID=1448309 RepID=A0A9P6B6G4_9AGAM|nr:hypothetical protein BS47DRAFT_1325399 [Hydnum rufescens UP504]